jgi:hypothetical protein
MRELPPVSILVVGARPPNPDPYRRLTVRARNFAVATGRP